MSFLRLFFTSQSSTYYSGDYPSEDQTLSAKTLEVEIDLNLAENYGIPHYKE